MTDTTQEAPERVWLLPTEYNAARKAPTEWASPAAAQNATKYIRADLVQAAVAAALREAVAAVKKDADNDDISQGAAQWVSDTILALITEDAQGALDRVVQAQQGARPIATAPRDGTHILVAPYGDPTDLQVSWFIEGEDRWANWSWSVEPSHWFPLPVIRKEGSDA